MLTWNWFCVVSKLCYMQCIETNWENGFENSNFVHSDSCFHGLILKLFLVVIFGSLGFGIGSSFLKMTRSWFEFESYKLLDYYQHAQNLLEVYF